LVIDQPVLKPYPRTLRLRQREHDDASGPHHLGRHGRAGAEQAGELRVQEVLPRNITEAELGSIEKVLIPQADAREESGIVQLV
jgi:hypothetical protein